MTRYMRLLLALIVITLASAFAQVGHYLGLLAVWIEGDA